MHRGAMNRDLDQSRLRLACLADASRFRIVLSLLEAERCVSDLASRVGLSQSCTTRHLQALQAVGLVRGARDGKRVVFRIEQGARDVLDLMTVSLGFGVEEAGGSGPDPARRRKQRDGRATRDRDAARPGAMSGIEPAFSMAIASSSDLGSGPGRPPEGRVDLAGSEDGLAEARGTTVPTTVRRRADLEDFLL